MDENSRYSLIVIGGIVIATICLRIFFTLWAPIDRRIGGDKLDIGKEIKISELKNRPLNVQFKSGRHLDGVKLIGYCTTHPEAPYGFRQLLILQSGGETRYYARIDEIEYFERLPI